MDNISHTLDTDGDRPGQTDGKHTPSPTARSAGTETFMMDTTPFDPDYSPIIQNYRMPPHLIETTLTIATTTNHDKTPSITSRSN